MKIVEVSGDARTIGRQTGEALREEIAQHIEMFPPIQNREAWDARKGTFVETLSAYLPRVLQEIEGTAEGANQPVDETLAMNIPLYPNDNDVRDGCTNVAFADGPDGPTWGKNNDGYAPGSQRPACGRLVRRDDAIPVLVFTFCGLIATTDGMNAEGLAMGHSSVGSTFRQSDYHVPIRPWAYECMMHARTTAEFVRMMSNRPTRGKGYSILCVDAGGVMCSIEAPCPVLQVRHPAEGAQYMNCVNYYQLPHLWRADRRDEMGKLNAISRRHYLEHAPASLPDYSAESMKQLLRHHGDVPMCRHGDTDLSHTEYSMIGLPRERKVLCCGGYACENEYEEISV